MPILVLAEAVAKPENVDSLLKGLAVGLPATRQADGCLSLDAHLEEDGRTIVAVESWESKAHYEKYLAWRRQSGALAAMESLLEAPLKIRFFSAALDV